MAVSKIDPAGLDVGQIGGRRNLIINGAMQVAQRGTSATCSSSNEGYLTVDRLQNYNASGAVYTVSQDSDSPDEFSYSHKVAVTTTGSLSSTQYCGLGYKVEDKDGACAAMGTSSAKDITLSFWIKASVTGTYGVTLRAADTGTANYTGAYTVDSASTWEYKTITFPATSSGTWSSGGRWADLVFDLGVGTSYSQASGSWNTSSNKFGLTSGVKLVENASATWQITGVQLEVGSVATPFEHRSYGDELALCQRYWKETGTSIRFSSTDSFQRLVIDVGPMRTQPTVTRTANFWTSAESGTTVQIDDVREVQRVSFNNTTNSAMGGVIECDAEL